MTSSTKRWPAVWPALEPLEFLRSKPSVVRASGHRLELDTGRTVLDGASGLWNVPLGYANSAIAGAIANALETLSFASLFHATHRYAESAAQELLEFAGYKYVTVQYATSGGAAVDLACKVARAFHLGTGDGRRRLVISLRNSYHGLTNSAFAITGEELGQQKFGASGGVIHIDANDTAALNEVVSRAGGQISAIVVEPVIGNGAIPLLPEFVDAVLSVGPRVGCVVIADEVATGFGRCGPRFVSDEWSSAPDILLSSKGLTNGTVAASAVLIGERLASVLADSGIWIPHAETQAGTPMACAAITATIQQYSATGALESGKARAVELDLRLSSLVRRSPLRVSSSGRGLMRSISIDELGFVPSDVAELVAAVLDCGAVVFPFEHGIQLMPGLTYGPSDLDELLDCVEFGVASFARNWVRSVA